MSITGAVTELNKEIERLTKIRDSLLQGSPAGISQPAVSQPVAPQKRKYVRSAKLPAKSPAKKSTSAKKSATGRAPPPAKKGVILAAPRRKLPGAERAGAATKAEAAK